jgi:hypothetical protein
MTKFRIGLIVITLTGLLFSSCNRHIAQRKEAKQYYYSCPMHQDYIAYQPGKCPKCGMTLEAWEIENMPRRKSGSSHSGHSSSGSSSGGCH